MHCNKPSYLKNRWGIKKMLLVVIRIFCSYALLVNALYTVFTNTSYT